MPELFIKNGSETNVGFVIKASKEDPEGLDNIAIVEGNTIIKGDDYVSACLTAENDMIEAGSPVSGTVDIIGAVVVEINGEIIPKIIQGDDLGTFFETFPEHQISFEEPELNLISCDGATSQVSIRMNKSTNTYGKVTVNGISYSTINLANGIGAAIGDFLLRAGVDGLSDEFVDLDGSYVESAVNTIYNFNQNNVYRVMIEVEAGDPIDMEVDESNYNPTLSVDSDAGVISFCLSEYVSVG